MKTSKNSVSLEGKAGNDPKITSFENGKVARVSIAVNDTYLNRAGETASRTMWFTIVFWNEKADLANNIKKGTGFSVEGKLASQKFDGKNGKTYSTEIIAENVKILTK